MKLASADLPKLQLSLLAALLMIALGAAGIYLTLNSTRVARLELAAAQKESDDIEGKLKRVRREEAEIKLKSTVFNALKARGVIGEEQRLDWVDLLRSIRDRHRLIDLRYEIAPQRPLDAAPGSAFAFYASTMKVELKLLHEEDLTRLLDDLRQQARALILVRHCAVSRLPRGGEGSAHLQAECQIDWITLRQAANADAGAHR